MKARTLIEDGGDADELKRDILSSVPEKTVTLYVDNEEKEVSTIVLEARGRRYLWGEGETSDVIGPSRVSDVFVTSNAVDDMWFIFFIADCYSPAIYAINAQSFQDAYEEFVDLKTDELKIEGRDLLDYQDENGELKDDTNYNSSGVPVNTESVQGFDATLIEAY